MGLLDGLLGGVVGAEMATVVNSLIQQHGGIQGVVSQLEQQGLGGVARSWIGSGPNQSISPEQLQQAFGGVIGQLAAKTGLSQQELTQKLASCCRRRSISSRPAERSRQERLSAASRGGPPRRT